MKYVYPPRPKGLISPSQLPVLERRQKYIVQRKFRGDRCLIHRATNGAITLFNRHGRKQKYRPPQFLIQELRSLAFDPKVEYWIDSELMDPRISNVIVMYDVLFAEKYLIGVSQMDRLAILSDLCHRPQQMAEPPIALQVTPHLWLAEWWREGFVKRFKELIHMEVIEGLVLRETDSMLDDWGKDEYEVSWQLRCRKPGPNYQL